jgi:N-acetylneuraminic acid mutarotase
MKTNSVVAVLLMLLGTASMALAQEPVVVHNTWTSGAPIPIAVGRPGVAVFKNQIYLVGGGNSSGEEIANTQIYNPVTNTWSTGGQLPTATVGGCMGVVNTLYFIGGWTGTDWTSAVWAYNPKTQTWKSKALMPTARGPVVCVVENGLIYVIGGYNGQFLATVESYNPATDTWTEEAPMQYAESDLMGGGLVVVRTTGETRIVVANGSGGYPDGHNQGYDAATNTWQMLPSDPITRQGTCVASIGPLLYSAGGWYYSEPPFNVNESFKLSTGAWTTLASMPQAAGDPSGVAYKGRLYCFGGNDNNGNTFDYVQIYQP